MEEDKRIDLIGQAVMRETQPKIMAVMVDDDGSKAQRYIDKLAARYPDIKVIDQMKGPTAGVVTIRIKNSKIASH